MWAMGQGKRGCILDPEGSGDGKGHEAAFVRGSKVDHSVHTHAVGKDLRGPVQTSLGDT